MPSATAREFQNAARKLGFSRTRQTGSHERWNHPHGSAVTIPLHGGREIRPPLFFKILPQGSLWTPPPREVPFAKCDGKDLVHPRASSSSLLSGILPMRSRQSFRNQTSRPALKITPAQIPNQGSQSAESRRYHGYTSRC